MAWMLAIPAAMAAMGYMEKKAQREQAGRDRMAEAEIARWSPWTKMQPQRVGSGESALGGAVAGGLQGASFMQSMKAAGYGKGEAKTADSGSEAGSTGGSTALASQPAPQQSMSMEDPNVLAQRRYRQYGAPQPPWNDMVASNNRGSYGG